MVYTLVSSAKEWLSEKYGQNGGDEEPEETEEKEEEVYIFPCMLCISFFYVTTGFGSVCGLGWGGDFLLSIYCFTACPAEPHKSKFQYICTLYYGIMYYLLFGEYHCFTGYL